LYKKHLGIDEEKIESTFERIFKLFHSNSGRGMTAKEINTELENYNNISRIINLMCDRGKLIRETNRKSWKSNLHTYYLFSDYFPDIDLDEYDEPTAQEKIIIQYLNTFGPSTVTDIAWWSGFGRTVVKSVLENISDKINTISVNGLQSDLKLLNSDLSKLMDFATNKSITINFLPLLDPYIMGYKERERFLNPKYFNNVYDRSGNGTNTILLDGNICGVWDVVEKHEVMVKYYTFEKLSKNVVEIIRKIAKRYCKFITGYDGKVKECSSMIPIPKRTAGSFMSPLKDC
jgi:hypothetical protein